MADWDPTKDGATLATAKPAEGEWNPAADGYAALDRPGPDQDSSPTHNLGTDFAHYYGGLEGMDQRLSPDQRKVFAKLDAVSDNSKEARAQAINQAYLSSQFDGLPHSMLERNWEAVKVEYAKHAFGSVDSAIPDVKLYGMISKRMTEEQAMVANKFQGDEFGENRAKPWTIANPVVAGAQKFGEAIHGFNESLMAPIIKIPEAPKDLPDMPGMGLNNPALVGAVFNGFVKPTLEGIESPFGIATLGVGTELQAAAKLYPAAKVALLSMEGVFAGLMLHNTVKASMEVHKLSQDPNATFQDKATAASSMVGNGALTLLGALGPALEMFPKEKGVEIVKELEGKNPTKAAAILRREAANTDVADHARYLEDGAAALDKIANDHDNSGATGENVPRRTNDQTVQPVSAEPAKVGSEVLPNVPRGDDAGATSAADADAAKGAAALKQGVVGIKNSAIDAQLKEMGLNPAQHGDPTTWEKERAAAAAMIEKNPGAGAKLINDLADSNRPPTTTEVLLSLHELNRLELERAAAEVEVNRASEHGDAGEQMAAKVKANEVQAEYQKAADVVTKFGTLQGQALAARALMIKRDYSLAAIERRRYAANGGKKLSAEQMDMVRADYKELEAARQKIADYEAQKSVAAANPVREAPRRPKPPGKVMTFISDQATQARARIKARVAEGRTFANPVDPQAAADAAIVGAEYIAKGIVKLSDWSVAMVNEFGEHIRPYLNDLFRQAIDATDQARRLQAYKTRTASATERLQEALDTGGPATKPAKNPLRLDPDAEKLRAAYQRVKDNIDIRDRYTALQNRSPLEKIGDGLLKLRKVGLISGIKTAGKVGIAGQTRIGMTVADSAMGALINKLPVIGEIAEGAPREGGTAGLTPEHIAKGYVEGWVYAADQAWNVLSTGKTDAEVLEGAERGERSFINYLVNTHALLKLPAFAQEYKISLRTRTAFEIEKHGEAYMADPINQIRVNNEAVRDGLRAKFSQDNFVVKGFRMLDRYFKTRQDHPDAGKIISGVMNFLFPIVKIPSNFFAESATYSNLGLGLPRAAVKTIQAMRTGIEKLTPEQKDSIIRHWKKGSLGGGLMLAGYYLRNDIGGYYQPGKQDKSKPEFGGIRVFGHDLPRWTIHMPILEPLHFGATIGHVMDHLNAKTHEGPGVTEAVMLAATGLLDEVPYVSGARSASELLSPDGRGAYARGETVKSMVVPRLVQDIAELIDRDTHGNVIKRKTETIPQHIKAALPILRQTLPARNVNTSLRE